MTQLSRRHVLLGGLTLAGVAACADKPILADPAEPVPPIHERIEALQRAALAIDVGVRSRETPDSSPSDLSYVRWAK